MALSKNMDLLVITPTRGENANELSNGFYLAKIISNKGFETKSFTLKK